MVKYFFPGLKRGKIFFSPETVVVQPSVLAMLCKSSFCAKVNPPPYHFRGQKKSRRRQARWSGFAFAFEQGAPPHQSSKIRTRKGQNSEPHSEALFPPPQQQYHLFCLCNFRLGDDDDDGRQSSRERERERLRITIVQNTRVFCWIDMLSFLFFFNCFLFSSSSPIFLSP